MKDLAEHQQVVSKVKDDISRSRNTGSGHVVFLMISGSHMYGFNSPNSDLDYRGAFVAETNHMLGLKPIIDVYRRDDGMIDVELFEIKKFLNMALGMNCNVIEHLFANHTLLYGTSWFVELQNMFQGMLCKKGLFDSYRGMAATNYKDFINKKGLGSTEVSKPGRKPTIKKYLYVLRALMAGTYVLNYQKIQPDLWELNQDTAQSDLVEKLILDKRVGTEKMEANYNAFTIRALDKLINEQYDKIQEAYKYSSLPEIPSKEDEKKVDKWLKKLRRGMLQV